MKRTILGFFLIGILSGAICGLAEGQKPYPEKAIDLVVAFSPGGGTDVSARLISLYLAQEWKVPVNVVNKPGAVGILGTRDVIVAKPDGYTLLGCPGSSLLVPHTRKDAGYSLESFAPVSCLVEGTLLFAVRDSAPWKNLKDLVADAKKRPNQITYSTSGTYGILHIAAEAFAKEAGIKLNHIPSQGSGPAVTATLGGHVDIASSALTPVFPHLKAGTLRVLAVFNKERTKALPDSPTFAEMGYPVVVPIYYGFLAPRGTPEEVVEIIAAATQKIFEKQGDFINDRLGRMGAQRGFMRPAGYAAFLKRQDEFFERVLKGIN